ncbi:hypothetical protein OROGR_014731 [Orobanche gracilis]
MSGKGKAPASDAHTMVQASMPDAHTMVQASMPDAYTMVQMRGGAGKSMPLVRELLDSGPRHTRARGVDASIRRQREAARRDHVPCSDFGTEDSSGYYSHDEDDDQDIYEGGDDDSSFDLCRVRKGRGGRFVASKSTSSKRSRPEDDTSWMVTEEMPGGPIDGSVIPSFGGHVARHIWTGEMRGLLKCHSRIAACQSLSEWRSVMSPSLVGRITGSGLSHLTDAMFRHIDFPLISAFVERWQPDTNSFHMPFGEMTIMLHDVWQILRIPIEGRLVDADSTSTQLQVDVMEVLGVSRSELLSTHWAGGGVLMDSIFRSCRDAGRVEDTQAVAWMWLLFGSTLFVDKSGNRIRPSCLLEVRDGMDTIDQYSWGSAALAFMYRQLGIASRGDSMGICGCLTLVQAWIYEYFPCFRPHRERMIVESTYPRASTWSVPIEGKDEDRFQSLRRRIDQLTAAEIQWLPYGPDPVRDVPRITFIGWLRYQDIIEPYMPGRALRQLGYVQTIPFPITRPEKVVRAWTSRLYRVEYPIRMSSDAWMMFPGAYRLPLADYQLATDDQTVSRNGILYLLVL